MLVDRILEERHAVDDPILFGLVGAGPIGRGIIRQVQRMQGIRCAVLCNRTPQRAIDAARAAGIDDIAIVDHPDDIEQAVEAGSLAVTDQPEVMSASGSLDAVLDATGHVEYGTRVALTAIENRKHLVLMNAELDATLGPLLKAKADESGVLISGCDGDQPAVEMNLYRFVRTLALEPLVVGSMKGMLDRYRTPATQRAFAEEWGQNPSMVTSFADGTKLSIEQAVVANAVGMGVAERGMRGFHHSGHIDDAVGTYDVDELRSLGGVVDYLLGTQPAPGVYVFGAAADSNQAETLRYAKLGEGPLYSFYVPYHLMDMEAPITIARVVALNDAAIAPAGGPVVDVVAVAKQDLHQGMELDGIGGFHTYGLCENHNIARAEQLLPIGLAEGAVMTSDVPKDRPLTFGDVDLPEESIPVTLWHEQELRFVDRNADAD